MKDVATPASPSQDDKVELSVQLDRDLLDQVKHLTSDPAKVIEVALRQWLRGDRRSEDDLVRTLPRNPTVPPRASGTTSPLNRLGLSQACLRRSSTPANRILARPARCWAALPCTALFLS